MSWSISTRDLQRLHSFEAAKAYFEGREKPRGGYWSHHPHERPLDQNRMQHKRIVRRDDGSYACILYRTALVTYHPDGGVTVRTHDSNSSSAFFWCVAPHGLSYHRQSGRVYVEAATPEGPKYFLEAAQPLRFKPAGAAHPDQWLPDFVPEPRTREVFNRRRAAHVRRELKPFMQWAHATQRLVGHAGSYGLRGSEQHAAIARKLLDTQEPVPVERWPELLEWLPRLDKFRADALRELCYDTVALADHEPPPRRRVY